MFHPAWEIRRNETSLRALAPCQSLGAYYVKPTPAAMKFLAKLSDWVVHSHIMQWDQAAWNEVRYVFLYILTLLQLTDNVGRSHTMQWTRPPATIGLCRCHLG